jgi:hypothetical protein
LTGKRSVSARVLSVALVCIVIVLSIAYIHEKYFFNPLTFRRDAFLYESWNAYKKPVSMEIFNTSGSSQTKKVTDSKQVRFVMSEIEKTSNEKVSLPIKFSGPMYGIFFHTGDVLFQQVLMYPDDKIVQFVAQHENNQGLVQSPKYVPLSPELLSYVEEQLGISQ